MSGRRWLRDAMKDMTAALLLAGLVMMAVAATPVAAMPWGPFPPPVTLPSPPPGFNPLTATPGQLARYGFPPRPRGGGALQAWERAMRALRRSG